MKIIKRSNEITPFEMFNHFFDEAWEPFSSWSLPEVKMARWPKIELSEDDKTVTVKADLPGVKAEDVRINVKDDILTISGSTKREKEEKTKKSYYCERRFGQFRRRLSLPTRIKTSDVKAKMKDGVLKIILPKDDSAVQSEIKVEAE